MSATLLTARTMEDLTGIVLTDEQAEQEVAKAQIIVDAELLTEQLIMSQCRTHEYVVNDRDSAECRHLLMQDVLMRRL